MLCPGWIYFCGARGQLILLGFIVSGRFWQTEWGNGEFELSKAGDFPDGGIGRGWGGSWSGLGNFWFGFIGVGGDWGGHWSGLRGLRLCFIEFGLLGGELGLLLLSWGIRIYT